jgi:SAM-dependent methyltransferase
LAGESVPCSVPKERGAEMNESKSILRRVVSRVARTISDPGQPDPGQFLPASYASSISAKYIPLPRDHDVAIDENVPADGGADLPVPPQDLWAGYALTAEDYLKCGRTDVATMLRLLTQAHGAAPPLKRVLDLGCAAGRMLRFVPRGEDCEHWGIDISAEHIAWCQANLSPPMLFATGTTVPHVPFEDRTFDLIYCGSVFTHISELAEAWLLELRRILRPGGYAYVTIHSRHTLDLLRTKYRTVPTFEDFAAEVGNAADAHDAASRPWSSFIIGSDPDSQVFFDTGIITRRWNRILPVLILEEEAHDHQAAVVMRKPST